METFLMAMGAVGIMIIFMYITGIVETKLEKRGILTPV